MKAFYEWWNKNLGGICGKEDSKDAWRAALEWVIDLPLQKDGPSRPKDLIECIHEELGDI